MVSIWFLFGVGELSMEKLMPLRAAISSNAIGPLVAPGVDAASKAGVETSTPTASRTNRRRVALSRYARLLKQVGARVLPPWAVRGRCFKINSPNPDRVVDRLS